MRHIIMFTSTHCPTCDQAKAAMKNKGIPFETVNILDGPAAEERALAADIKGLPTIIVEDDVIGELYRHAGYLTSDGITEILDAVG